MHYELECSSSLGYYMLFLHGFAVLGIVLSSLHWLFIISLLIVLVIHFVYLRKRYYQHRLISVDKDADDYWCCIYADQQRDEQLRLQGSLLLQSLIIIYFRQPGHFFSKPVLILPDMISAQCFRRLSVYLRHVNHAAQ